jgi:hypothetical protein
MRGGNPPDAAGIITGWPGKRRAARQIPANILANSELHHRAAWSHSIPAGVLWENGIRLGNATTWAEEFFPGEIKNNV